MIVTNVGDLGTLVRDNKLGYVVQKKSVRALHDALVRAIVCDLDIKAAAKNLLERFAPSQAVRTFVDVVNAGQR
jgi:hypothetical protein